MESSEEPRLQNAQPSEAEKPLTNKTLNGAAPPPNGGVKAWLQVLGSWCLVFSAIGMVSSPRVSDQGARLNDLGPAGTIVSYGLYQAYYERGTMFTESSADISWIGSIQSLLAFALGALSGPIYDRGHLRLLLVVGAFCIVFGHMMLSLCQEYWQVVLAQGFVIGIGAGCLFVPALAVAQPYFSTRLPLALGIIGTGSSIGCVIYAVIFINLIDRVGFAWTIRALGFVALGVLSIPVAVLRMHAKPPAARSIFDLSAVTDVPFLLATLGCFLGYGGSQVSFFYIAYYGQANGWLAGNLALYLLPIVNAGAIIGRVIPNVLAAKIGPVNVMIPGEHIHAHIPTKLACSYCRKYGDCRATGGWLTQVAPMQAPFFWRLCCFAALPSRMRRASSASRFSLACYVAPSSRCLPCSSWGLPRTSPDWAPGWAWHTGRWASVCSSAVQEQAECSSTADKAHWIGRLRGHMLECCCFRLSWCSVCSGWCWSVQRPK